MWVLHKPGTCTGGGKNKDESKKTQLDETALTAALTAMGTYSEDEINSKVQAILSVIEN